MNKQVSGAALDPACSGPSATPGEMFSGTGWETSAALVHKIQIPQQAALGSQAVYAG